MVGSNNWSTKIHRYRLGLGVVEQRLFAQLSSNARLLEATERQLPMDSVVLVHPHRTRLDLVRDLDGGLEVFGVDTGGQSVGSVICGLDNLVGRVELGNYTYWTEDFFPYNVHVAGDAGKDGWLHEVTWAIDSVTPDFDLGAGLFAGIDVSRSGLATCLRRFKISTYPRIRSS